MSPREIDRLTPWEFEAVADGWMAANASQDSAPPPMDDDDLAAFGIEGF